jgi:hypothetical protein
MNHIHESKPQWPYSPVIRSFLGDFYEIESLISSDNAIGPAGDKLTKLKEKIVYLIPAMALSEFESISAAHLFFYMQWLALICYYGGGSKRSLEYFHSSEYN